jgi:type VI secretion system secreted protein Hcp
MARSDMFLKLRGERTGEIQGESNDKTFVNQIDVVDWSWGMSAPTAVGGQRTGRTQFRELKVVKAADKASTALMTVLNQNERLTNVVLSVRKAGGAAAALPYYKVTLENARITDFEVQSDVSSSGAPTLTEHLSFTFTKVTIDYTLQAATGGSQGGSSFVGDATPS